MLLPDHERMQQVARSSSATVVLAGATIGLIFWSVLVAPLPFWEGRPSLPGSGGGGPPEPMGWMGLLVALGFALTLCLPYRPYIVALRALSGGCVSGRLLVALTAVLALVSLAIYPRFGSDVFDYAGFERMWVVYGDNPLVALVSSRPADWGAGFVWYPDQTPGYGPLWAVLTWPLIRLAGESRMAEVVGYKLLSTVAYVACCWLIWASVEQARRQRALVAFAWSPLVLFEVLGKAHNDSLPAVSVLAMVWLVGRGNIVGGILAIAAGALTKPTALLVVPLLAVELWRRGAWRGLLLAGIGCLVLVGAAYAPFWIGLATLHAIWQQAGRVGWSPATLLTIGAAWVTGTTSQAQVRLLLGLVWVGAVGLVIVRRPAKHAVDLAARSGWVVVLTLLLLAGAVFAHYFVAAVALAAVAADARLERLVLWLSIGGLAAYSVELLSLALGPAWIGSTGYDVVGSLVLLGPAATAMLVCSRRRAYP